MPVSKHRRNGPRRHTNRTFGSHMNGKCIDRKLEYVWLKQGKGDKRK
jgi:hypothetical protein